MINITEDFNFVTNVQESDRDGFVQLFLIKYNSKIEPILYKPILKQQAQKEFLNIYTNFFNKEDTRNRIQRDFDLIIGEDDTFSNLPLETFNNTKSVIEKIRGGRRGIDFLDDLSKLKLHTLTAYAVKISFDGEESDREIIYFSSIQGFKNLKKGIGFFGNVTNNAVTRVDPDDLIGFKPVVGGYINEENVFLISSKSIFESTFKLRKEYVEVAKPVLAFIKTFNKIDNYEQFEKDTLKNYNLSRRVAMLNKKKSRIKKLFENIPKVEEALLIEEYSEKFEGITVKNGKILYNTEYKDKFVTLISDSAVISFITEEKFITNT